MVRVAAAGAGRLMTARSRPAAGMRRLIRDRAFRQLADLGTEGIVFSRLRATLLRRQTLKRATASRLAPGGQVRRIQALAAKQPPDLARARTAVRLLQDPKPILGGELAPGRLGDHLRVRSPPLLVAFGPWGRGAYATRPHGPSRPPASRWPGLSLLSSILTSPPYTNSIGRRCLGHIGREGPGTSHAENSPCLRGAPKSVGCKFVRTANPA